MLAPSHREQARIVTKAMRERERRDAANEELARIKREAIEEATAANLSSITKTHPVTGQRITVYNMRTGSPINEAGIAEIISLIPDAADRLFPPVTKRSWDWGAIQDFLTREYPAKSNYAIAQRRIAEAIRNDPSWAMKLSDPKRITCIECQTEVAPDNTLRLCKEHKTWYKISYIMLLHSSADREKFDLKQWLDLRRRNYRQRFLTRAGLEGWALKYARKPRAKKDAGE